MHTTVSYNSFNLNLFFQRKHVTRTVYKDLARVMLYFIYIFTVHLKLQLKIGQPYPQGDNTAAWFHCRINSVVNLLKENYVNVKNKQSVWCCTCPLPPLMPRTELSVLGLQWAVLSQSASFFFCPSSAHWSAGLWRRWECQTTNNLHSCDP